MILDLDVDLNSIYGINDTEKIKIIPGAKKSFYGAKHLEDFQNYDEYEYFSVKIDFKTNLDNIKDDLSQQLLDDTLVDMFDYSDEEEIYGKYIVLQSRCEL